MPMSIDVLIERHMDMMEEQRRGWPSYRRGKNIFYAHDVRELKRLRSLKRKGNP